MKKQNSKQNASTTGDFINVVSKYDLRGPGGKNDVETYIIQSNRTKNKKTIEQI